MASKQHSKSLRDEVLIHGYCRRIQSLLKSFNYNIPVGIIEICIRFYQITAMINIAIGQAGIQIMSGFYESIFDEYNLDKDKAKPKNDKSFIGNTYLRKNDTNAYIPRCIAVDLEPGGMDVLKCKHNGFNIDPYNYCFGSSGAGNNWAKGYCTEGAELIDEIMDNLRNEIEKYDEPQAIQFMHSICGGTGISFCV